MWICSINIVLILSIWPPQEPLRAFRSAVHWRGKCRWSTLQACSGCCRLTHFRSFFNDKLKSLTYRISSPCSTPKERNATPIAYHFGSCVFATSRNYVRRFYNNSEFGGQKVGFIGWWNSNQQIQPFGLRIRYMKPPLQDVVSWRCKYNRSEMIGDWGGVSLFGGWTGWWDTVC
jgi:hypothetical protein